MKSGCMFKPANQLSIKMVQPQSQELLKETLQRRKHLKYSRNAKQVPQEGSL